MSISSTRKISSSASVSSRIDRRSLLANNHSQFVENIDTTNNVLVRDESNGESNKHNHQPPNNEDATNYNSSNPNIVNGIEAIASSIAPDEQGYSQIHKIDVFYCRVFLFPNFVNAITIVGYDPISHKTSRNTNVHNSVVKSSEA